MNRSSRRLLIITDCSHGGTFHVATLLAEGLRDAFAVSFAAPSGHDAAQAGADLANLGIAVHTSALSYENLDRSSYAMAEAADILDATQPDIVLSVDGAELSSLLAVKSVAQRRGIPYVVVINLLSEDVLERFVTLMDESKSSLAAAAAVVFVSDASRMRCERLLPDVPFDAHVIPNSCPDIFFEPTDQSARRDLRRLFGVADGQMLCLTAARIEDRKGQALGIAALGRLKTAGRLEAFKWILAGRAEAWDRQKLDAAIATAGVGDHISLIGERSDVDRLMDASDLFVLTSYAEGMPLCIIEAIAKGVPVIATAVDGIVEQIDETCGVLLPPATEQITCIDALTHALDGLERDRVRLARMSVAARERSVSLFHRDIGLSRYRTLLATITDAHRRSSGQDADPGFPSEITLDFSEPRQIWDHLQEGWASCEQGGIWTNGAKSTMRLRLNRHASALRLQFEITPYDKRRKSRITTIYANDQLIGAWRTRRGRQVINVDVNTEKTGRNVLLRFENPGATRPCDIGESDDYRQLGLFFHRLDVVESDGPTTFSRLIDKIGRWFRINLDRS